MEVLRNDALQTLVREAVVEASKGFPEITISESDVVVTNDFNPYDCTFQQELISGRAMVHLASNDDVTIEGSTVGVRVARVGLYLAPAT